MITIVNGGVYGCRKFGYVRGLFGNLKGVILCLFFRPSSIADRGLKFKSYFVLFYIEVREIAKNF